MDMNVMQRALSNPNPEDKSLWPPYEEGFGPGTTVKVLTDEHGFAEVTGLTGTVLEDSSWPYAMARYAMGVVRVVIPGHPSPNPDGLDYWLLVPEEMEVVQ